MTLRLANENDARGILAIYTPYITSTSFTFEPEVPTVLDFSIRIHLI
jgi:L-amino acid N-acyltransferase YncA